MWGIFHLMAAFSTEQSNATKCEGSKPFFPLWSAGSGSDPDTGCQGFDSPHRGLFPLLLDWVPLLLPNLPLAPVPGKSALRLCLGKLLQSDLVQRLPPGYFPGTPCLRIGASWVAVGLPRNSVEMPWFVMGWGYSMGK